MIKDQPLSDKEINELQDFLMSDATPENCMDMVTMDGFLTAVVSGPEAIMPSEWLSVIWGDKQGPEYETLEQAQNTMNLLMRHMNGIATFLMEMPGTFEPILYVNKVGEKKYEIAEDWCFGYLEGVKLRKEEWKPLTSDDKYADMIMPIITLISSDDDSDFGEIVNTPEKRQRFVDMLPESIRSIHKFWLERRKPSFSKTPVKNSASSKIGRNMPCPCGSGKKFKKCCGASGRVN